MAARREDLPSRRLSLLEQIKDLIETHNSKQNGSENSSETAQRVSRPSQLVTRHRRVNNRGWCKISVPFSHHFLPALLLVGGLRRRSYRAIFKQKKRGRFFLCCASTSADCVPRRPQKIALQNARLGWRKVVFPSKVYFVAVKEKLEIFHPKLKDGGGFELLRMGSPSLKQAYSNISRGWRIFSAFPAGCCGTWPGTGLYQATPNGPRLVSGWKCWAGMRFQLQQLIKMSWTLQPNPTCKSINKLTILWGRGALPVMTYTGQSLFQSWIYKRGGIS